MRASVAALPLHHAPPDVRVDYLRRVLLWTVGGLGISATVGTAVAGLLYLSLVAGVDLFFNRIVQLVIILGSFYVAQSVAQGMVFGGRGVQGFLLGTVAQGVAMGYLLLFAVLMGAESGSPFSLVGTALGLTVLSAGGMVAYVSTGPREFKMLGATLGAVGLPMLVLMGVGFAFPGLFGGTLGLVLGAVFVAVSAAGLLYQINLVLHTLRSDQHIEGSYMITMGLLVLYWNILSLLMRRR